MRRVAVLSTLLLLSTRTAGAQLVPGRDLLGFPLGLNAEAPALGTASGLGLWNPATILVPVGARLRLSVGSMSAPVDVAVSAQFAAIAAPWRRGITVGLSVAAASVKDLLRTDSDPESLGDEIPYTTTVVSLLAARRIGPATVGTALRLRTGTLDNEHRSAVSVDAGVLTRGFGSRDVRLGASTFLASPFKNGRERASLLTAIDARVAGRDTLLTARAGVSSMLADGLAREEYGYVSGRVGRLEGRVGAARTEAYGRANWRARLGVAFHHRGYVIAVAREESAGNLSATYQFSLSSVLR